MLPSKIMAELLLGRAVEPETFDDATVRPVGTLRLAGDDALSPQVLFAEICGFKDADLAPDVLVESLNVAYSAFDQLVETHGVHKIETVGEVNVGEAPLLRMFTYRFPGRHCRERHHSLCGSVTGNCAPGARRSTLSFPVRRTVARITRPLRRRWPSRCRCGACKGKRVPCMTSVTCRLHSQAAVAGVRADLPTESAALFSLRIGLHSGPLVAGVVG